MNNEINNGLILVNKPKDYTSFDVINVLKKLLKVDKAGHTGTLDKNATGLLVCLIGNSTKYQDYFLDKKKIYESELVFGLSTDTEDILGKKIDSISKDGILSKYNSVSEFVNDVKDKTKKFIGKYNQVPPMYSNKKIAGKKLLSYARAGEVIDRKSCDVYIYNINVDENVYEKVVDSEKYLAIKILVECSKGTYIRTLCKDIGDCLSIPSCMGELDRKETDGFSLKDAYTLEEIKDMMIRNDKSFIDVALYNKCEQVVTFGKFDCVHAGHRKIMKEVVDIAKERGYESSVLTFSINPKIVLGNYNDDEIKNIITKEQLISYLKLYGIKNIHEFPFNDRTKDIDGESFVKKILIDQMKAKIIVVGDDCTYGKGGACKAKDLSETCKKYGVELKVIDRVKIDEIIDKNSIDLLKDEGIINNDNDMYVSSSLIRKIVSKNYMEIAYKLVGHRF